MAVNAESKADKNRERFENALRELLVGAKVEGQPPAYSTQYAAFRVFVATLTSRCLPLTCR